MEELKFERDEGTWAAAPGLDFVSDNGCRSSSAARPRGCTVYSNMTLSPAVGVWEGNRGKMECDRSRERLLLGRDQLTLLARQNRFRALQSGAVMRAPR